MGYNDLSASDYMELNKINKKFNEENLTLDEKIRIKNRLLSALSNSYNVVRETEYETRSEVRELYSKKLEIENIESLVGRNIVGFTENDKIFMKELKENDIEKYNLLTLNYRIHFEEDGISLNLYRGERIKIDRDDLSGLFLNKTFSLEKANKIAKKKGKKLMVDELFRLSEIFGRENIIKLFNLKEGNYWANYYQNDKSFGSVIHTDNLGTMRPVPRIGCSMDNAYTIPTDDISINDTAFVRMYEVIEESKGVGMETIIR